MTGIALIVEMEDGTKLTVEVPRLDSADGFDADEWCDTVLIPAVRAAGADPDFIEDWWPEALDQYGPSGLVIIAAYNAIYDWKDAHSDDDNARMAAFTALREMAGVMEKMGIPVPQRFDAPRVQT